jgi:hypothetical protein
MRQKQPVKKVTTQRQAHKLVCFHEILCWGIQSGFAAVKIANHNQGFSTSSDQGATFTTYQLTSHSIIHWDNLLELYGYLLKIAKLGLLLQ